MLKKRNTTGPTLQAMRESRGLTRTALSRGLREQGYVVSPTRLKHMEEQTSKVYSTDLEHLAVFYGVTISALFPPGDVPPAAPFLHVEKGGKETLGVRLGGISDPL